MTQNNQDSSLDIYSREIKTLSGYKEQSKLIIPDDILETKKINETKKIVYDKKNRWEHDLMFKIIGKHIDKGVELSQYKFILIEEDGVHKISYISIYNNMRSSNNKHINYFRNLMKGTYCKIIFIPIIVGETKDHINWIIIDKVRKTVELYEPHGSFTNIKNYLDVLKYEIQCVDKLGKSMCFIPRRYKFISREESCPILGFQGIEGFIPLDKNIDLEGYCYMWAMFFMDLRLSNLYFNTRQVQTDFIKVFSGYDLENLDTLEDLINKQEIQNEIGILFRDFIRKYSLYYMLEN